MRPERRKTKMSNNLQAVVSKRVSMAIARIKKTGVVGMSAMNLYMITDTSGLSCPVAEYRAAFAAAVAKPRRGFEILSTELDFSSYDDFGGAK
jgi:hypothetical protein